MNAEGSATKEQRIFRVASGESLPIGWEFEQLLGKETGSMFPPYWTADVVLASRALPSLSAGADETETA